MKLMLCKIATPVPAGRTILAPDDAAFLGSVDNWERECWGLHIFEVPLLGKTRCLTERKLFISVMLETVMRVFVHYSILFFCYK
jgi:hypothetical protein